MRVIFGTHLGVNLSKIGKFLKKSKRNNAHVRYYAGTEQESVSPGTKSYTRVQDNELVNYYLVNLKHALILKQVEISYIDTIRRTITFLCKLFY